MRLQNGDASSVDSHADGGGNLALWATGMAKGFVTKVLQSPDRYTIHDNYPHMPAARVQRWGNSPFLAVDGLNVAGKCSGAIHLSHPWRQRVTSSARYVRARVPFPRSFDERGERTGKWMRGRS